VIEIDEERRERADRARGLRDHPLDGVLTARWFEAR
jgi:hypothetical protein